jgi:hypothetical protein
MPWKKLGKKARKVGQVVSQVLVHGPEHDKI